METVCDLALFLYAIYHAIEEETGIPVDQLEESADEMAIWLHLIEDEDLRDYVVF